MPLIILIFLITGGWLFTEVLVLLPLGWLELLKLPSWLSVAVILLTFFWYFGE